MSTLYIILVVAAILIVGIALVIMTRPRGRRDVKSLYTEGLDHLLRGNLKQAYQCFKGVIDRDTEHTSAYLKLGQVMRRGGASESALKLHESLLVRSELTVYERVELLKNLALDHGELRQYDQAVERVLAILKLEKRNAWALRHLVKFYRGLGNWEAAGKYLAQWQKATDKEDTRLLALCRFRQGYDQRHEESPETIRGHYQQALKIDGNFAPAQYFLAESYVEEADSYRRELSTLNTSDEADDPLKQQNLEEKVAKLYSQAVAHWSAFLDISPSDTSMVLPKVEDALFYLQRFDDMEPFLKQILGKDPDNLDVVAGLANFYVRKGDLDRAEVLLSTIPEAATSNPLIQAIQLKLSYRQDDQRNLKPELDHLVDSIRLQAQAQASYREAPTSLMSWLDPSSDPLEKLE
ncbi:MAG: tetratricopeptide repeat protein [Fidelibacterota bacterium]|nr:MAG: tetratricopeptide repeat protein [Candidatus Neomarinimicrobiota bacterium]